MIPWILIAVAVLIILLAVVAILIRKKHKSPPDYYSFFVMGIIWLPIGIAAGNSALWMMGLAFMAVGLVHKDEWKKNHRPWNKLDKGEQKLRLVVIIALGVLVFLAALAFFLAGIV